MTELATLTDSEDFQAGFAAGLAASRAGDSEIVRWELFSHFWVAGKPKAQPRTAGSVWFLKGAASMFYPVRSYKAFARLVRKMTTVHMRTPDKTGELARWKACIDQCSIGRKPEIPFDCAARVDVVFYLPRPKYRMRRKDPDGPVPAPVKPDADNLAKAVLDAMTKIGWWTDDGRVVELRTLKIFHGKGRTPGALISVYVPHDDQDDLFNPRGDSPNSPDGQE